MRAQAHTVEALVAAILILGGLVFATQATAVTPLSASTSNQHIETQQQATVDGLLATAARNGTLQEAVLHWNVSDDGHFAEVPDQGTYAQGPPNAFGKALNQTLRDRQIAFNVNVRYTDENGAVDSEPMVRMGEPSDNAVAATQTIGLYDTSNLTAPDDDRSLDQLADGEFYVDDVDENSRLYAVVEVEVIAWRK